MNLFKKNLQTYLNKTVLDKVSKYGITELNVYKLLSPIKGERYGTIFVLINIPSSDKKYSEASQKVKDYIYNFLNLMGEIDWDWDVYVGPLTRKSEIDSLEESLPFKETIKEDSKIRVFSESTDDSEFKWHQDNEDRLVKTLHPTDWMVQLDNELPQKLLVGKEIFIKEGVWHRVIKGTGNLKVQVKFV